MRVFKGIVAFSLLFSILLLGEAKDVIARPLSDAPSDRYYIRVSKCDDGARAYVNGVLMVDVGFDEDSNWLDITESLRRGRNHIIFKVLNKTGAITYLFQIRKNNSIVFEQTCGTARVIGCQNNRAYPVGVAARFTATIRR